MYADELLALGDPRGELIRLQLEREQAPEDQRPSIVRRERELLAKHESLSGPGRVLAAIDAAWRRGYVSVARSPPLNALRTLLSHPSGLMLDELVLDNPHAALDEQVALVGRSKTRLRALTVRSDSGDTRFEGSIELGGVLRLGELRRVTAIVRQLGLTVGERAPSSPVTSLELSARWIPLGALEPWSLPSLRDLVLSPFPTQTYSGFLGARDVPLDWPALSLPERVRKGLVMPALEQLTLRYYALDGVAVLQLVELTRTHAKLTRLDLSECALPPELRPALTGLRCEVKLPPSPR